VLRPADLAACRQLLAGGSKSFHAASRLLPRSVAEPATALYAWCRVADDAIDLDASPAALAQLRARLEQACAGTPFPHPADRALAAVIAGFGIPRALPEALLEGFAWDRAGRQYEDFAALTAYAARVAGTVGAMMALLMGERRSAVLARACDLGVAMQLTNIARDVGEDARAGRLYLPHDWMRQAGLDPAAWLAEPVFDARVAQVVARLLAEADALYRRADAGIARLPLLCRPGIGAARLIYAAIGQQVARHGHDSISRRAVVSGRRKLALAGHAALRLGVPHGPVDAPPLPATRFLIAAVEAEAVRHRTRPVRPSRVVRAMELMLRVEEARLARRA
jgi:phytoene synthase